VCVCVCVCVQVVGLDASNSCKRNRIVDLLEGHLGQLRASRRYRRARIFVFIEANYGVRPLSRSACLLVCV